MEATEAVVANVLAMLAHPFLAVTAAAQRLAQPHDDSTMTSGEDRRLLAALILNPPAPSHTQ